ncbi:ComEC/Rec2 family competence protein [Pseudomonas botevensis]|uniref:hypothetical protein n=1 Tax=Pseudomonas botevensis TaxID=2842352 RepID=UPI001C3D0773|nr:hypothetical protein [Pseudomonas botevensis]MBV4474788.1 hypothetical protein [Pseudomonas botevensis]
MNAHFQREEYPRGSVPIGAYARFDHLEVGARAKTLLLAFDLVEKNWLDTQGKTDPLFSDAPSISDNAWKIWNQQGLQSTHNPFESMPVYRLELEIPATRGFFGQPPFQTTQPTFTLRSNVGELESKWFVLDISPVQGPDTEPARLYPGLFADPVTVYVKGTMPTGKKGEALSSIFSLAHLPSLSTAQLESELSGLDSDLLAVYDVGQGNANALLSTKKYGAPGVPTLYYDLGAGVYRNRRTTPKSLVFCFTEKPTILLSHWDADHWAGAYASMIKGAYPALSRKWIAPLQNVGPVHIAFAHDVLKNGGKFFTYADKNIGSTALNNARQARFTLGDGPDRNCSGIVLVVEEPNHTTARSWLLTGDCDYVHFVTHLVPLPPVAMVVPHHGADLDPATPVPKPPSDITYKRLAYSFGHDNRHGQTNVRHPTVKGVSLHNGADWDHQYWDLLKPGETAPGGDVLATCEHSPGAFRGGVLIGWDASPAVAKAPCQGRKCTTSLTQS